MAQVLDNYLKAKSQEKPLNFLNKMLEALEKFVKGFRPKYVIHKYKIKHIRVLTRYEVRTSNTTN